MQEEKEKLNKEPTVDIDTSGPDVEVELPVEKTEEKGEDKTYENERETKLEDGGVADNAPEKPVEQPDVQAEVSNI